MWNTYPSVSKTVIATIISERGYISSTIISLTISSNVVSNSAILLSPIRRFFLSVPLNGASNKRQTAFPYDITLNINYLLPDKIIEITHLFTHLVNICFFSRLLVGGVLFLIQEEVILKETGIPEGHEYVLKLYLNPKKYNIFGIILQHHICKCSNLQHLL